MRHNPGDCVSEEAKGIIWLRFLTALSAHSLPSLRLPVCFTFLSTQSLSTASQLAHNCPCCTPLALLLPLYSRPTFFSTPFSCSLALTGRWILKLFLSLSVFWPPLPSLYFWDSRYVSLLQFSGVH